MSTDGQPVENANVVATSIPNNVNKSALSAKDGRYAITFPNGEGDYWISVRAIGFEPRRFELKRLADEAILVGDTRLARSGALLDAVTVKADRARPARNGNAPDVSGTEKSVGSAAVDPNQAGNLAAMAATLPGVQLIPGAEGNPDQFSVYGLGGDQNNSTLNGIGFAGGDIPRDATTRTSLGTTPWDVSRGGFSGGQFGVKTQSGSNFSSRALSSLLTGATLEWTDRAGASAGAEYTSFSLGASTAGPISLDRSFYSAGYQLDRRFSDQQNLSTADALALRTAGVSPDSVTRLRNILGLAGVPGTAGGLPSLRMNDKGSFLAALDFSPPTSTSGQSLNLTAAGSFNRNNAPFGQINALPTADARSTNWFGSLQARHTNYFGPGVLTESSLGVSRARAYTNPYLSLPNGSVRVSSTLDDGSTAISSLFFGGSTVQNTSNTSSSIAAQNQLSWFSLDNQHRLKFTSEFRYDAYDQDFTANQLGSFAFNSLSDIEAGRPTSFTRLLSPRVRGGRQVSGGVSIGDSYRPAADVQIQYGIRADGNRFLSRPSANPALAQLFGADNSVVPNRVYLSPRLGVSWTYGQAAQLAIANGFTRGPRAVVRAGIGLFQNVPNTQLTGSAMSNTGLPGAVRQLTCVGAAVPTPAWAAYLADASSIPNECADGTSGTVFSSSVPNATLFDRSYSAQRSLRSNMNWTGGVLGNRFSATVDGTYSLNLNQAGFVDLNFKPVARFTLADEAARPVYVNPASIVATTGAIAAPDARLSQSFAHVTELRSDLQSVSRQLIFALKPLSFSTKYSWELAYVYSNTRDLSRGFTSTTGNPLATDWSRSPFDSRHQIVYSLAYNVLDWFPVSFSGSFRSGRPFTPLVAGDVNGDGYINDRAFIFNPAALTDPALAAGMRALLSSGSSSARGCLAGQLGALATRNSCQAPWTATSNLTIGINPVKFRLPQRMNVSLFVSNALGAADLLLHGENSRRGWGQSVIPDATLLFVRGFDASARRFKYEINPRFGATNLNQTLNRNPVVVTAQVRMDIGFTRERQLLTQSLDRGRGRQGDKATDQELKGLSNGLIPPNPMALVLQQADSLKLTRRQADSLSALNRRYTVRLDSIWTPVAKYLASLPEGYDPGAAYERYRRAREASVDMLISIAPALQSLLAPQQKRALPASIASSLDARYLASVRSSTAGSANMGILGMLAQMNAMGGASVDGQTVMIHK